MPKATIPAYYQIKDFVPSSNRGILRHVNKEYLHFSKQSYESFRTVMHYFSELTFERVGVLRGEYISINGLILIGRDGICIKANMGLEQRTISNAADDYHNLETF